MRAIESVSDQLQHSPDEKNQVEEEEKTKSHKVVSYGLNFTLLHALNEKPC